MGSNRGGGGCGRILWSLTGGDDKDSIANVEEVDSIGAQTLGLDGCPPVAGSAERRFQFDTPPKLCIDTGQLYAADSSQTLEISPLCSIRQRTLEA